MPTLEMKMAAELTYESAFPGRFLKAGLFLGKHVTLTVDTVNMEVLEAEKGKENKLIIRFVERGAELVVCKTNALCFKEMFGSKVSGWIGKRVTLYPTRVQLGPKQVDAIRVFGSPDIAAPFEVTARIGRKAFKATMAKVIPGQHGFKGGAPTPATEAATTTADPVPDFTYTPNPDAEDGE